MLLELEKCDLDLAPLVSPGEEGAASASDKYKNLVLVHNN
jgi:hypothetical protein